MQENSVRTPGSLNLSLVDFQEITISFSPGVVQDVRILTYCSPKLLLGGSPTEARGFHF